jgi:hypothetical protein
MSLCRLDWPLRQKEVYEWFSDEVDYCEIDGYSGLPSLRDQGAALGADGKCPEHFHCFPRILEKFGSG